MFHAKNDKEMIAIWRSDLNRILHIFNVRSATPAQPPLTVHFQTELSIDTNIAISDTHRDVTSTNTVASDTHAIVSEIQRNVTDTQTIVSEIHRTLVGSREGTDGKNRPVSVVLSNPSLNQCSPLPRLEPGW